MAYRTLSVLLVFVGMAAGLYAADAPHRARVELTYDILEPSTDLAQLVQKRGDYAGAVLLDEAVLKQTPSDPKALKQMIQNYKALEDENKTQSLVTDRPLGPKVKAPEDDPLSDLPDLIPPDSKNAQQNTSASHNPLL